MLSPVSMKNNRKSSDCEHFTNTAVPLTDTTSGSQMFLHCDAGVLYPLSPHPPIHPISPHSIHLGCVWARRSIGGSFQVGALV